MRLPATRPGLLALHVAMQLTFALVCGALGLLLTASRVRDLDVSILVGCWIGTAAFGKLVAPRVADVALRARRFRFEHATIAGATSFSACLFIDWLVRPTTLGDIARRSWFFVGLADRFTGWLPSWLANGWRMAALGAALCFFSFLRLLARTERSRRPTSTD